MRRIHIAAAVAVTALAGAAAAGATTGPDPYTIVNVTVKDGQLVLSKHLVSHVTYVDFIVSNKGKQPHNFTIGGQTTRALKPGEKVHLLVTFPVYGSYPFKVTLHGTRVMRGRLQVEAPEIPG
jgi:plastocyanin